MLIAFNKPFGVLSQFTDDGSKHRTLAEFHFPKHAYPLGRLDAESEGLLLLSDEAALNARLLQIGKGDTIIAGNGNNIANIDKTKIGSIDRTKIDASGLSSDIHALADAMLARVSSGERWFGYSIGAWLNAVPA